jgi:hypothetical protein
MQVPEASVRTFCPFQLLTNQFWGIRIHQPPYTARGGAQNARLRRIITGDEVVLTTESVAALQKIGDPRIPGIGNVLKLDHPEGLRTETSPSAVVPFLHTTTPHLASDGDPWFMGGLDPFSTLPETANAPISKEILLYHCKNP